MSNKPEDCRRCGQHLEGLSCPDLSRATQALHDAAVAYAVANTSTSGATAGALTFCLGRLTRAAEDYADAYLRGGK